jgi:opacity protein-like surface antigen
MRARHSTTLAAVLSAVLVLPVAGQEEQVKEDAEDFARDIIGAVFHTSWYAELHGGYTNIGRIMLQRAFTPGGFEGERALRGSGGYALGLNAGVNLLLRTGLRIGYTYSATDLSFRTDIGNGSSIFDIDDLSTMSNNTVALEVVRYLLPARSKLTPYVTVGVSANWWGLDDEGVFDDDDVFLDGGDTQFRWGRLASIGMKGKVSKKIDLQLEYASASIRSPFSGGDSYRIISTDGFTIDEETRVNQRELRLGVLYHFGSPPARKAEDVVNDGKNTRNNGRK